MRATLIHLNKKKQREQVGLTMAETIQCVCKYNESDDVVEKDDCIEQTQIDENLGPFILASLDIGLCEKIRKETGHLERLRGNKKR
ncbi:hypothetical protein Hanom_Chr14g01320371 [Helianthus anomalus]